MHPMICFACGLVELNYLFGGVRVLNLAFNGENFIILVMNQTLLVTFPNTKFFHWCLEGGLWFPSDLAVPLE